MLKNFSYLETLHFAHPEYFFDFGQGGIEEAVSSWLSHEEKHRAHTQPSRQVQQWETV